MRYIEPTKEKRMIKVFKNKGYKLFLVDVCITSKNKPDTKNKNYSERDMSQIKG
jgi:hypothetical protein